LHKGGNPNGTPTSVSSRSGTGKLDLALRLLLTAAIGVAAAMTGFEAAAVWCARDGTEAGLRRAIRLDPSHGRYHTQLARTLQFGLAGASIEEVLAHCERAAALDPHRAEAWADLGAVQEWVGRMQQAQGSYERARELFPHSPAINWKLANFYIRANDFSQGFAAAKRALTGSAALRQPAFDLAWRASADPERVLKEMLPAEAGAYLDYINYLTETQRMDAAARAWARLLELQIPFEPRAAFGYLGALVQHRRPEELLAAWEALSERHPGVIRSRRSDSNHILNGDFESEPLNGGLDWRLLPLEGAEIRVDSAVSFDGVRSLRVKFDGRHNLEFAHVLQFVPVSQDTAYEFSAFVRTEGIPANSAPLLEVFDAYDARQLFRATAGFAGTTNWVRHTLSIRTGPATKMVVVRLARPRSTKLDNLISGTVWLDRVALHKAGSASR
jgi:tetratricopeptide (TPR) repeat protein